MIQNSKLYIVCVLLNRFIGFNIKLYKTINVAQNFRYKAITVARTGKGLQIKLLFQLLIQYKNLKGL